MMYLCDAGAIWAKDQDLLGRNYPSQRKRRQGTLLSIVLDPWAP